MKINIPKVILSVQLGEYAPELQGKVLHVWVNMPKEKLQEYDDLVTSVQEQSLAEAQKTLTGSASSEDQPSEGVMKIFDQLKAVLNKKRDRKADSLDVKLLQWYAEMWSQGPEETHWTVDELQQLEAQDPAFLSWCIARSWAERNEHVQRKKKV
jgi:hypothetical protein